MKSLNINRYILKLTFLLSWIILLHSCTERIDIELDSTYTYLAVEGYITTDSTKQYIRLTETADYFSNTEAVSVTGATVIVNNGSDDIQFSESPENPGYYFPPEGFTAIPEVNYSTTIDLEEPINNDSHFEANETMPMATPGIDSIAVVWEHTWRYWRINFYAQEPPTENFYMFNAMVNGVMITDSVSRVQVIDDRLFNGSYTNGVIVMGLYENEVKIGDTVTLILSNITEEYYNYILELQEEITPNNPIFSGSPANVSTNISNNAVGYFASFTNIYVSTIVNKKEENR